MKKKQKLPTVHKKKLVLTIITCAEQKFEYLFTFAINKV